MSPDRFQQVQDLYLAARLRRPEERALFLAEASGADVELRREVESLLSYEEAPDPIERPAIEIAADLLPHPSGSSRRLKPGDRVGQYLIEGSIGQGGMGEVFRARDNKLNRPVAIKILSDVLANPDSRRRFQREAQMASSLNHPHILTVYDADEFEGCQYIVTELIDGGTLKDWAKSEKRTWRQIAQLLTPAADGIATAHNAGIIHRDIKPANILVAKNGFAKLADFGVAKLLEPTGSGATKTLTGDRTPLGLIMGTVAYMSPEQASGQTVDARSDIFSFGVVLYELLAGQRPFSGKTELEVLQTIIHGAPEPLDENIPIVLRLAVDKALAKDPAERYQTMRDMVVDLRRAVRQGPEAKANNPQPSRNRSRWAWAALVPALLVAGYLGWRTWRIPQAEEPLRAVPLTTFPGIVSYPTFAPDGDRVAFVWTGANQDNADIYVQQIGSGAPLRLTTDPRNDFSPAWSPDGRWIAFLRAPSSLVSTLFGVGPLGIAELRLIPPLGGPERKIADIQIGTNFNRQARLAWCPASDCLVAVDASAPGLVAISLATGEKKRLTSPQFSVDSDPAISPDGSALVFRRATSVTASEIYWLPLGKGAGVLGEAKALTDMGRTALYPTWMPDGKEILFYASGGLRRLSVSGKGQAQSRPARLAFVGEDGFMPVVSPPRPGRPSRLVYLRSFTDTNIWRVKTSALGAASSSPPAVLISSTRGELNPAYSPDGRRVAFGSDRSGNFEIWVADSDGSNPVQLTSMGATATLPAWSPDGQQIAFHCDVERQFEIYVMPASGGQPRRLTTNPANDGFFSFSPDGQWVYFGSNRSSGSDVWKVPVSGGDAIRVTNDGGGNPTASPDGKYVYYNRGSLASGTLWRLPVSGGQPEQVLDGLFNVGYVVLEKGVYYMNRANGETRLRFLDLATGRSTTVANNLGDIATNLLSASPDGRSILYVRPDASVNDLMLVESFR
jgi:serine/threonine protein kinase